jgi:LAO/AO transport system kinase
MEENIRKRAEQVLAGHVVTGARLIRDLDDQRPEAIEVLKRIHPHTGRAHVVGVTGNPGAGKSTVVDCLITWYRAAQKKVGVIAIDPTSPFSGGAILGDRIRMQRHATDPGVFIRSMASRGHLGGLSRSAADAIAVLDAMGMDVILVETVGVGQGEVDIVTTAHTTAVVVVPGLGDEIQAIKAGIMEIADVLVINKADRQGVDRVQADLRLMLDLRGRQDKQVEIIKTVATQNKGITELAETIVGHRQALEQSDLAARKAAERCEVRLIEQLKIRLLEEVVERVAAHGGLSGYGHRIAQKAMDPYTAVDEIVALLTDTAKKP